MKQSSLQWSTASNCITLIESAVPKAVCKTYDLDDEGRIKKKAVASIVKGQATTMDVSDAKSFIALIDMVAESTNLVICPGEFKNAVNLGGRFTLLSQAQLADKLGCDPANVPTGVITHEDHAYGARLKDGITQSSWILFDADNPEGMPDQWKSLDIAGRLALWEPILPGITQCERIEARSSSERVINGLDKGKRSHAWIQITNPELLDQLHAYLTLAIAEHDVFFYSPRFSRISGEVIGQDIRSVFDLSTFISGRLVFNSLPDISRIEKFGYSLAGVDTTLINEGNGAYDNSWIRVPNAQSLDHFRHKTGLMLEMRLSDGGLVINNRSELDLTTEITVKEVTKPLREWISEIQRQPNKRLRCEAPFRDSYSAAAFMSIEDGGAIRVYDSGTRTNYWLKIVNEFDDGYELDEDQILNRREDQRKEAERIGAGDDGQLPLASVMTLEEMLDSFAFVGNGSEVYSIDRPTQHWTKPDFMNYFASSVGVQTIVRGETTKRRTIPVSALWLGHPLRKTFETISFVPGCSLSTQDPKGRSAMNLWRPRKSVAAPENWTLLVEPFLDHIHWLFGEYAENFIDWLAHIEQHPGTLPHYGFLHIAKQQGMGRNWISSVLARVFKGYCAPSFDLMGALNTGFNEPLGRRLLAIVDEIHETSGSNWKHANSLKKIMTEEYRTINAKHVRQYEEFNCCRFLMFSNHENALPLNDKDRRWFVVASGGLPKPNQYYKKLYGHLKDQAFIDAVVTLLRTRNLSEFNPGERPPMTMAKTELVKQAQSEEERLFTAVVNDWPVDIIFQSELNKLLRSEDDLSYLRNMVTRAMGHLLEEVGIKRIINPVKFRTSIGFDKAWSIRNHERWLKANLDQIRAEQARVNEEDKFEKVFSARVDMVDFPI
jgi:hypothetical protein